MSDGKTGVVEAHWDIFHMTAQEEARCKRENMDRIITIAVREFLQSVDYRAISFNVDLKYTETDRHAEVIAYVTETRKARFEKA